MHCEICGREIESGYLVEIEGARLVACSGCAERGVIIRRVREGSGHRRERRRGEQSSEEKEVVLVADYGRRIREARERAGLSVEELAKRLRIPETYLRRVEEGELTPTDDLARRLEKLLKVTLFEEIDEEVGEFSTVEDGSASGLTLGDVVRLSWGKKR